MEVDKIKVPLHKAIEIAFDDVNTRLSGETNLSVTYLAGSPGGGKTKSIRAKCKEEGYKFTWRNMGMIRTEELGGIPDLLRGRDEFLGRDALNTEWSIPELIVELRDLASPTPEQKKKGELPFVVVLLDDWHLSPPNVQALGFELFTDYAIKRHAIPPNVMFVLAGNDSPAAGARNQFSAIMNRAAKYYVETDFEYWRDEYAYKHDVFLPVVSFLESQEYRPLFHGEEQGLDPWPSPRSWTNLSTKLKKLMASGIWEDLKESEKMCVCAAHVGHKAGQEFFTYYNIYMKFNTKQIYDTNKWKFPKDPMERFAFAFAITHEFYNRHYDGKGKDKKCQHTFGKILEEVEEHSPELAMSSLRYLIAKNEKILVEDLIKSGSIKIDLMKKLFKTSNVLGGKK